MRLDPAKISRQLAAAGNEDGWERLLVSGSGCQIVANSVEWCAAGVIDPCHFRCVGRVFRFPLQLGRGASSQNAAFGPFAFRSMRSLLSTRASSPGPEGSLEESYPVGSAAGPLAEQCRLPSINWLATAHSRARSSLRPLTAQLARPPPTSGCTNRQSLSTSQLLYLSLHPPSLIAVVVPHRRQIPQQAFGRLVELDSAICTTRRR